MTQKTKRGFMSTVLFAGALTLVSTVEAQTPPTEVVLHHFGGLDGSQPVSGVIGDWKGNLYGTTVWGGTAGVGVVYKIDSTGMETVLHSFTGGSDGASPNAGLIRDPEGNLFGTCFSGGIAGGGSGVLFEIDAAGQETVLHTFTGGTDGGTPNFGVTRDPAGNLYGTATYGGLVGYYDGLVYRVNPAGEETVLYSFTGGTAGIWPDTKVTLDPDGNLYSTTTSGGAAGYGEVYKIDSSGRETVLYSFTGGKDGGEPYFGVTRNAAGDLFGTTDYGGFTGYGVVYKLDSAGKETVLHTFRGGTDGAFPNAAGVLLDAAGNLYGTTKNGGPGGCGVVYKLDAAGEETILYSFTCGTDGSNPFGGVIRDADGNLYGTTNAGGEYGLGVVFKIVGAAAY